MNYRRLGRSELVVSVVGFGTTQLRRVPETQAIEALKRAFALGVNLVNTGPDYEGSDALVARALREVRPPRELVISCQAGGGVADIERAFEETCAIYGRGTIDLFGLGALSEQEAFGHDVWGPQGTVEFLRRKKEEGRIRALYASDHGNPEQMRALLERDVFDVLMLAYNPLGFHIISFRPDKVWQIETPPVPLVRDYTWEDIPRTGAEILPLARARDVGILLMKPLAGGLLTSSKAFPPIPWREGLPDPLPAGDVLRYLLKDEGVAAVVPGMASVAEVEENVAAVGGDLTLEPTRRTAVERGAAALSTTLCSRRGACEDTCSQGLPVSFIFRAAYHYLYPSAPFEVSSNLQYFKLHPWERARGETCEDRTCRCPSGVDVPREMIAIHQRMLDLRARGIVPRAADHEPDAWATGRPYSLRLVSQEVPATAAAGEAFVVRLQVRNTGTLPWPKDPARRVALAVSVDGRRRETVPVRHDVWPMQGAHFAFSLELERPGRRAVEMALEGPDGPFARHGVAPLSASIEVTGEAPRREPFARIRAALRNLLAREA